MNEIDQKKMEFICAQVRDDPLLKEILDYLNLHKGPHKYSKMANELIEKEKTGKSKSTIYAKKEKLIDLGLITLVNPNAYTTIYVDITTLGREVLIFGEKEEYFSSFREEKI